MRYTCKMSYTHNCIRILCTHKYGISVLISYIRIVKFVMVQEHIYFMMGWNYILLEIDFWFIYLAYFDRHSLVLLWLQRIHEFQSISIYWRSIAYYCTAAAVTLSGPIIHCSADTCNIWYRLKISPRLSISIYYLP